MDFPGFLGNEDVKSVLSAAFETKRFPHAVLLTGEAGCGKRTFSRLLAKALVCRDASRAPCGSCPSCIRAAAGSHPDIRFIEPADKTRSLTVDAVKDVIEDSSRVPEEAEVSVYILVLGTRPSEAAQNKLLKVVEEPPAGAVFLMICESAELLLPTIRSRTQSFTLRPPAVEEAADFVREKTGMDPQKALELAALCGGNIGRMLDQSKTDDPAKAAAIAESMARAMLKSTGDELLKAAAPLLKDRVLCREVLVRLGAVFRDACVLRAGGESLMGGAPEAADELGALPMKRLVLLPDIANDFIRRLDGNANMGLLLTCLCAKLRQTAGTR